MSYDILSFTIAGEEHLVLHGLGEYEGTNVPLRPLDIEMAYSRSGGFTRKPWDLLLPTDAERSAWRAENREALARVAAYYDFIFLRAHGERLAREAADVEGLRA